MNKIILTTVVLLCGCSNLQELKDWHYVNKNEQERFERLSRENQEAHARMGTYSQKERHEEQEALSDYIANKAQVLCKSQGFKAGTADFNQCATVTVVDLVSQIKQQEEQENIQYINIQQQQYEREQAIEEQRRQNAAFILMNLGNTLRRPQSINCDTYYASYGSSTHCY